MAVSKLGGRSMLNILGETVCGRILLWFAMQVTFGV